MKSIIIAPSLYTSKLETKKIKISKLKQYLKKNNTSHEIIDNTVHEFVHPYFDIDLDDCNEEYDIIIKDKPKFLNNITELICKHFYCEYEDLAISETLRKDKISYHIVICNNRINLIDFCKYMKSEVNSPEFLKLFFDLSVYKKYNKFRMILCKKENQKAINKPITYKNDILKHVITATSDDDKIIKLEQEPIKPEIKKYCTIEKLTNICNALNKDRFIKTQDWITVALSICRISTDNDYQQKGKDLLYDVSRSAPNYNSEKYQKYMNESYKYNDQYSINSIINFLKIDNKLKYQEIILCEEQSYTKVKESFEKDKFKLISPSVYCIENKDDVNPLDIFRKSDFSNSYENVYYYDKNSPTENYKKKFLKSWYGDEDIRTYNKMDFIPDKTKCPKNVYNLFTGFEVNKHQDKFNYDESKINLILNHIKILVNNDDDSFNYFIKWLAHILQKPNELSRVAIVLVSEQGAGKNIFLSFFADKILGKKYYHSSEDIDSVFGKYAEGLKNKLLVNLDEATGKDTFRTVESIKAKITNPTILYEKKYVSSITLRNYARFIFTSNNMTPVKIDIDDRRYSVFKSSSEHIKLKDEYFEPLKEQMDNLESQKIFYEYLMNIDINNFNFEKERPITEIYKDIQSVNIPKPVLYLMELLEKNKLNDSYPSSKFYKDFIEFVKNSGYDDYKTNKTRFGRQLKEIKGVNKTKSGIHKIVINNELLLEHLKEKYNFEVRETKNMFRDISDEISDSDEYS